MNTFQAFVNSKVKTADFEAVYRSLLPGEDGDAFERSSAFEEAKRVLFRGAHLAWHNPSIPEGVVWAAMEEAYEDDLFWFYH